MTKILFIADMHGEDPTPLVREEARNFGIERVVFLGDYDTPKVLRNLRKLRIPKKFIVGNHDYHYIYELGISGQFMTMSAGDYSDLWNDNSRERKFIEKLARNASDLILEEQLAFGKVAYAHASLVDAGSQDSEAPGYVWGRMTDPNQVLLNFAKMKEKNYRVFFRGHDHTSAVLTLNAKSDKVLEDRTGDKIKLQKSMRHIVNVGAFFNGDYAVFDDISGKAYFWNTNYGPRQRR